MVSISSQPTAVRLSSGAKSYVVYSRNPIVLVRSHTQLRHDIALGAFVHDTRVRHIVCVDILEEEHD
jgi:hypothetical protein